MPLGRRAAIVAAGSFAITRHSPVASATDAVPSATLRTSHLTSGLLRDPQLGPSPFASTFTLAARLEDEPLALRVAFANDINLSYRISAIAAALASDYGDSVNPADGAWVPIPGASGRDLVVPGNGGGPRVPRLTWSRWADLPPRRVASAGGAPILFLRASAPAWSAPRCCNINSRALTSGAPGGRNLVPSLLANTDAATDPRPASDAFRWDASPFYAIQYRARRAGTTVMWGGDSHFAGDTTRGSINTFALQSCLSLSTPDRPVSPCNYAWGGSPSLVFMPLLREMAEACRPQIVLLQGWTANDGSSRDAAETYARAVSAEAALLHARGITPVIITRFSRVTLGHNAIERATADYLRATQLAAARPDMPVVDATAALDDPAHPGCYKPGYSTDGIHPNDAGHAAVAAALTPVLRTLVGAAG